jgi:hypothetical protein
MVGHKNWVQTCKFSPDSKYIMSGSDDGTLKLWDVNRGDSVVTYRFPTSIITSPSSAALEATARVGHVQFHPDGNMLAASGSDGNVHMFDLRSDKVVHSIPEISQSKREHILQSLSFHPEGNHLMTSSNDKIMLWDVRSWNCAFSITHHDQRDDIKNGNGSSHCTFSSDGSKFVTGGSNKRVVVWKANFEKPISVSSCKSPVTLPVKHHNNKKDMKKTKVGRDTKSNLQNKITVPEREYIVENIALDGSHKVYNQEGRQSTFTSDEVHNLPESFTGIFDHIIGQLDLITNTMIMLEKRLIIQEESLSSFLRNKSE